MQTASTPAAPRNPLMAARGLSPRKQMLLVLIVALLIVIPRSLLIVRHTTETFDEPVHLGSGLNYLDHRFDRAVHNDPHTGQTLLALPAWLMGARAGDLDHREIMDRQPISAQAIRIVGALFLSTLFCGLIVLAYAWGRRLYGPAAGWIAAVALLIEPTFAAHTPIYTLDVLGVESIALACFLLWQYFETPTRTRLLGAAAAMGAALVIKFTAMGLPAVVVAFAGLWWIIKPFREKVPLADWRKDLPWRLGHLTLMAFATLFVIWALNFFETGPLPFGAEFHKKYQGTLVARIADAPWPAPTYVYSFLQGARHDREGHAALLWGEVYYFGRWYYFPVMAAYKVPLGLALLLALGVASLTKKRIEWKEWAILIPILVWTALLLRTRINIGFRHFMVPYFFMLLWASRCVAIPQRGWLFAADLCIVAAALHVALWTPNYLAYVNAPRSNWLLVTTDSNIDWGQGLAQVETYLKTHPPTDAKPVYLAYHGSMPRDFRRDFPGRNITDLGFYADQRPTRGVLILSQSQYVGLNDPRDPFRALRNHPPTAVIAGSILLWDLDTLPNFAWDPLKKVGPSSFVHEPVAKMDRSVRAILSLYRIE